MYQIIPFLSDTVAFHRRHKAVTALVWLTSCIVASMPTLPHRHPDNLVFVVLAIFMAALTLYMLARYERVLDTRIAAIDTGPVWQVQINGVTVGEMKDADYAAIRRAVFFDYRVYLAQFFNLGDIALWMVNHLFAAIPLWAFWLVLGCFFFAPDSFAEAHAVIQKVTPAQATAAIPMLAQFLIMVFFLTLIARLFIGHGFGFVNQFGQACATRVRRAKACAAEGEVLLYRFNKGACIFPDERMR